MALSQIPPRLPISWAIAGSTGVSSAKPKTWPHREPVMPHRNDASLIARMLTEHGAALELYGSQWTRTAEDCVQEALIELARLRIKPDNPRAWLYRVVRYRAINMARSASRRAVHEQLAARLQPSDGSRTESTELRDAVASLPEEIREAVVLRVWGGLTWEESADVTGASSSTMQRRFAEGLRNLQRVWETDPCRNVTNGKAN